MYFVYSIILAFGFLIMSPLFLMRRQKYASGFRERMGYYPPFIQDGRPLIWLHCVSVGETNAARPLVDELKSDYPGHRLLISTTTKTGQDLAKTIFDGKADAVVYFPFDFKFSVRRAIRHFKPSVVLLMETEIWPRFIREAKLGGSVLAIVNGRLSERSASRYSIVRPFISRVLADLDVALMQAVPDAKRITALGMPAERTAVTGNMKFDLGLAVTERGLTDALRDRFALDGARPLIVAASTHEPEERWVLEAFCSVANGSGTVPRLLIVPRHPERFDPVADLIVKFRSDASNTWREYNFARRSEAQQASDKVADIILLDTVGELRAAYPLADVVFVGGSLVPHGGQSILEPAAAGKTVITGPHTHNFSEAVKAFLANQALVQIPDASPSNDLYSAFSELLKDRELREEIGGNALTVMSANRGATSRTIALLSGLLDAAHKNS